MPALSVRRCSASVSFSYPDLPQVEYYLCGLLPVIRAAIAMLTELMVSRSQVISDGF